LTSGRNPTPQGGVADIVRGMILLGRGSQAGLSFFGNTTESFLNALAPNMAWQIVGSVLLVAQAPTSWNATKLLVSLCVILVPPVVSHAFARRWSRDGRWLRYATASLWCGWLSLFVLVMALMVVAMVTSRVPSGHVVLLGAAVAVLYDAWLRWFIAQRGLGISGWRALALVVTTMIAVLALYGVAKLLPPHFDELRDFMVPATPHGH